MDKRICPSHLKGVRSDFLMKFILDNYKDFPANPSFLDLGSGRWRHAFFLKSLGYKKIICIDKTVYENKPAGVRFIKHNLEYGIPVGKKMFDIIICCYLLMFIENKSFLLKEINKISKCGSFLLIELNERSLKNGHPLNIVDMVEYLTTSGWMTISVTKRPAGRSFLYRKILD